MNLTSISDEELLKLIAEDDTDAFKIIFDKYYHVLVRALMRYSNDPEQIKDWVQEIYGKLWESRKTAQFETILNFKAYFIVSARNHAIRHLQKKNKPDLVLHQQMEEIEIADNNLLEYQEQKELLHAYQSALSKLSSRTQEVYYLNREKGLTYSKIAEELGVSVKTVEAQISRAMAFLRQELVVYLR
ncbi:MAG: sigma-70 family RNA polymerase sigma factor [Dyadobacter sp.]|uniref:RNA polymerase sigma factor n=1 Tax=Dyadobacter sp. TaxID=1914288 RepID=UPI0032653F4A